MNLQTIMDKLRALEKRVEQLEEDGATLSPEQIEAVVAKRRGRPPKELTDGR